MSKFFRNNTAHCVIRLDDDGRYWIRTFDNAAQLAGDEQAAPPDDHRVQGPAGIGQRYPLTEISEDSYNAFGFTWRYGTENTTPVIVLDDRFFTIDDIVRNRALDDLYNDGRPYDDIAERLGTVSNNPMLDYPARQTQKRQITIEDALRLAIDAHEGQTDLDGKPVILHPLAVGMAGRNRQEIVAGFLHDVVEDTDMTLDGLLEHGVDSEIVDALRLLTHDKQVSYDDYVERIATSGNHIALHVKFNDLTHNLNRGRAGGHWKQVRKHEPALRRIIQAMQDTH